MNFRVDSAHPVRTPGPAILLKLPFDTAFPKLSELGVGSSARSMSTKRGSRARCKEEGSAGVVVADEEGEVGH